jgi:hypothetical protein
MAIRRRFATGPVAIREGAIGEGFVRVTGLVRRLRFGRPIVIVSGLPRSGTSMMMKMLAAGGLPLVTDGIRTPDDSNPEGYFELEAVKDLDKPDTRGDLRWLAEARGRGVKILSPLLAYLPDAHNYRVIFMQRPLAEVIASQDVMLARAGEPTDLAPPQRILDQTESHLRTVHALLVRRPCFETLPVDYHDVLANPRDAAARVSRFVGDLAVEPMAAAVNERLYRQRTT